MLGHSRPGMERQGTSLSSIPHILVETRLVVRIGLGQSHDRDQTCNLTSRGKTSRMRQSLDHEEQ